MKNGLLPRQKQEPFTPNSFYTSNSLRQTDLSTETCCRTKQLYTIAPKSTQKTDGKKMLLRCVGSNSVPWSSFPQPQPPANPIFSRMTSPEPSPITPIRRPRPRAGSQESSHRRQQLVPVRKAHTPMTQGASAVTSNLKEKKLNPSSTTDSTTIKRSLFSHSMVWIFNFNFTCLPSAPIQVEKKSLRSLFRKPQEGKSRRWQETAFTAN